MKCSITVKDMNGKDALITDDGKKLLKVRYGLFWKKDEKDFDIAYSEIESIENIKQSEIQVETVVKQKNAAGRALVGGLVFGPLGAVVGGFSGIGNNEKKKEKKIEHEVLHISLKDGTEHFFAVNDGNTYTSMIICHVWKYLGLM